MNFVSSHVTSKLPPMSMMSYGWRVGSLEQVTCKILTLSAGLLPVQHSKFLKISQLVLSSGG